MKTKAEAIAQTWTRAHDALIAERAEGQEMEARRVVTRRVEGNQKEKAINDCETEDR